MTDAGADRLKDDFLTCPLCLELYKEPKLLECQHTFCMACLERYILLQEGPRSRCICPLCRESTTVPGNDVRRLRKNLLMIGLLHFATSNSQQDSNNNMPTEPPGEECSACEEAKSCITYCGHCEMWLCASCTRSHSKLPATKSHNILSLTDINTQGLVKLRQIEEILGKLSEETDTRYDAVLQQHKFVTDQMDRASAQINAFADEARTVVEQKRDELLVQLTQVMSGIEGHLNKVLVDVEGRKSQLDQAGVKSKGARESSDAILVMRTVQELQQSVRQLPPLTDMPANLKSACGVQFLKGHSLLSSLQSDILGLLRTSGQPATLEALCYPHNQAQPSVKLLAHQNTGFISGVATYGSYGNAIFITGCKQVYRLVTTDMGGSHVSLFAEDNQFWKKPWGVAVTSDNKVLITDAGSVPGEGVVAIYGIDGKFQTYLASGLSMPRGIAINALGKVFVCDQDDRCIYVFDSQKNFSLVKVLKKGVDGKQLFVGPQHVAVSRNLDIIVSDLGHVVRSFTPAFYPKAVYQSPFPDSELWGVCTDPDGHVYAADWKYGVHVLSGTDDLVFEGLVRNPDDMRILEPCAVAFHAHTGRLFIGNSVAQVHTVKLC